MATRFNPPPNWPPPPAGWTPPPGWQPDPTWGPPPPGWQLWVSDRDANRRTNTKVLKVIGGAVAAFVIFAAGVAAGGGLDTSPAASALSVPRATVTKTAEATVTAAPTATATVTATETVKKKVVTTVTAEATKKSSGGGGSTGGGGGGTDPQFSYCYEANAAGYGPYYEGEDPEYYWYDDRDNDGVVCEY